MSCLQSAKVLACLSFLCASTASGAPDLENQEAVVFAGKTMKAVVPEQALRKGSVQILPQTAGHSFATWTEENRTEAFDMIQRIVQQWDLRGIHQYLIYGKEDPASSFKWEVVPYPEESVRLAKQFTVLWNIVFGGTFVSPSERNEIAQSLRENPSAAKTHEAAQKIFQDPFCNSDVVNRQRIFAGKKVDVLYNYAPIAIGEEKLHFLIIPKEHREKFSDLTLEEYLEANEVAQKLIRYYANKGYATAYLFDKNGPDAGQTVPHWHEHLVFTASKTEEVLGKLKVFKNMLFYSSPLPPQELQQRVQALKAELTPVLTR